MPSPWVGADTAWVGVSVAWGPLSPVKTAAAGTAWRIMARQSAVVSWRLLAVLAVAVSWRAFARAVASGRAVTEFESNGKAAEEIRALWEWLKGQME